MTRASSFPLALPLAFVSSLVLALPAAQAQEAASLSQMDLLSREIGLGIGHSALDAQQPGAFTSGYAAGGSTNPDDAQGSDYNTRGAVLGYGFGSGLSAFMGYAQGTSEVDGDLGEARIRSYFLGAGYAGAAHGVDYAAALYMGRTHNKLSSPSSVSGSTDHNGRLLGLSLRGATMLKQGEAPGTGIDLVVSGDVLRHATGNYTLHHIDAEVENRVTYATSMRLEMGAPMRAKGGLLRPYAAYVVNGGDQPDLDFAAGGSLGATDLLSEDQLAIGLGFEGGSGFGTRIEAASDFDGTEALSARLTYRF
ncbi:hypothetical protein [Salipiger sp. PrR002]|uniref:hypothetical protein n=1 Tax=Salipiger sp. PrR002 TaxID=2706489 RepID=UPI0013B6CBC7|nr:hypothetical protein [Salipiger sp. PrR002]NDW00790.1 hypothetical protein [Salipiger sp. PrR002]NDW59727.1 hypothetical protein [Salipiger sp. PrR004]